MSPVTTTRTTVAGIHHVVVGDGPRTVVLLHGFADNLTTWARIVPRLAVTHRVVAMDLPGFGLSTRRWTSPLLGGYVETVREVLDAEGIDGQVSLIGNSMGGVVAALFAHRYPERTEAVTLIDMPGLHGVPKLWHLAMSRPAELGMRTAMRVLPPAVAQVGLGLAYSRIAAARPRNLAPTVRQGFTSPYAVRGSVPSLLPIGRALLRELGPARLGQVVSSLQAPVLIVFGSRDVLTPARVLRRVGRPGGAVVLPACGHCPQIDQPQALLAQVEPFLQAAAREARSPAAGLTA